MITEEQKETLPFEAKLRLYTLENTMEAAVVEEEYEIAAECVRKIEELFKRA
ncbi:hypothetical protein [Aridibaculum aurantiacum]|uniref:hypothetical protein n=1 Tax=Aridibaculum aurantiacum TaxID=2810307 RepID=UPI001A95A427|nr:hypothetical protein [Aridibaculum aurantiacum]